MLQECCGLVRNNGEPELIVEGDEGLQVTADDDRIEQVIINLLNNALKYAPASKKIFLIAEQEGESVKVSVKDSGPGISPDKIPYLFDRYYRADYTGQQYSGMGLGLYISREIILRHNGKIGVDSEVGTGSTFWFTLPRV
jgi:signal transduction histidine kinase